MKTIDLTIIADRACPTSRTYLTYLKAAGYKARKIILVHFTGRGTEDERLLDTLGHKIGGWLLHKIRSGVPCYPDSMKRFIDVAQSPFGLKVNLTDRFDFSEYTDDIQYTAAKDYEDEAFQTFLKKQENKTFLYTNGGIVPASLLNEPNIKFIHIHPGVVPYVRGSDGLLWSVLTRGKPGVSCFYMDTGIDTGDLIGTMEFNAPRFDIPALQEGAEEDAFYRALLIGYDPHLRAQLICDVFQRFGTDNLANLPSARQTTDRAENFLWMHPKLRLKIFRERLCRS